MKCLVKGCLNHYGEGVFRGELCSPCHEMLTTGKVHPKNVTFIGMLNRKAANLDMLRRDIEEKAIKEWPIC